MKEIKYRIHIPDAPQLFGDPMYYQGNQYLSSFLRRVYSQYECNHPSYLPFQIEERLELFIGLQDKNNKDIYQGDIIDIHHNWKNGGERALVEWDEDYARFGLTFYSKFGGEGCTGTSQHIHQYTGGSRIIGNIRENQELLTSKE